MTGLVTVPASERSPLFLENEWGTAERPPSPHGETGLDLYVDIGLLLEGGIPDPPSPTFLSREDGIGLFYEGQVNSVFGDPESGKTWIALAACAETLGDGCRVLVIDLDHNGPERTTQRLLALGAPIKCVGSREHFRYVEPEDEEHLLQVVKNACEWKPAVVVVDSMGELLPLLKYSSNSPDDFTMANARILKPFAKGGAAVILIDHLAKGAESRASGATGTAAKKRAIGGVALRVKIKEGSSFTPGKGGTAYLFVHKDRGGGLKANCPTGENEPLAGSFVLSEHDDGSMRWHVTTPAGTERQVRHASSDDLVALDNLVPLPTSVRDIKGRLGWGTDRASNAWRDWRSRSPERLATCATCPDPMDHALYLAGEQTHPGCPPAPPLFDELAMRTTTTLVIAEGDESY